MIWALSNVTAHGSPEQIHFLTENQVIEIMVQQLDLKDDPKIIVVVLECLEYIFKQGQTFSDSNPYLQKLEALSGIEKIEELQSHKSTNVYKTAQYLLSLLRDI